MTWEEYQNTDFYKESHHNWNVKESREDKIRNEMRNYLGLIDEYNERVEERIKELEEKDEEVPDCLYDGTLPEDADNDKRIVRYITTRLWNGRVRGILRVGTYKECAYAKYNYNFNCIDSEWDWAGIERIEAADEDELSEILDGYRECEYYDYDYDYDY